jgi:arylsulfatase A-like enzyme
MLRRSFLGTLAGGLASASPGPKRNFVLILADDLGARDLACYGNRNVSTPHLDRLARDGARFTNAYAACPVCSPTRASILTGRYPVRTGVTDWIPGRPSDPHGPVTTPRTATELRLEETTIAEALKPAGYRSASIGKWHLGGEGFLPPQQGFDVNIGGNHTGSPPRSPKPYFGPAELPNLKLGDGEFLTGRLTREACGFIEQNRANPFFLYLAHYAVHIPLGAPYPAMIESVDESVGAVVKAIDAAGVADRTMIVFFSDNGGLCYEGRSPSRVTDNSPFRAGKGHLYEGGIREPLIIRTPAVTRPGMVIDTPVCSIDLLPTFVEGAKNVDGVSLMPLLRGGTIAPRALFWHYPHYSNQGGEPASAIRDGDWKLIEFLADGRRELFNLKTDEGEQRNLVEREPAIVGRLAARLAAWRKETGAVMPTVNPAADPHWPGFGLTGEQKPVPPLR